MVQDTKNSVVDEPPLEQPAPGSREWQQVMGERWRKEMESELATGLGPNWPLRVAMILMGLTLGLSVDPLLGIGILAIVML